jgi:MFS family permease
MNWILIVCAVIGATVIARYADRNPAFGVWWFGFWTVADAAAAIISAVQREWGWAAWIAVCAVIMGLWWRNCRKRRKRKRAAAMAGAKSRALIEALVKRVRETARPRPVLKPVLRPAGAGA